MKRANVLWSIVAVVSVATLGVSPVDASSARVASSAPKARSRPNVVFVLTDDLDLASYVGQPKLFPKVHDLLVERGTTFSNYFVTDSLCCPSRASILRGQYVHSHGVESNLPPVGGFEHWQELGRDTSTVATWLHDAGYRTALFGKYLNGYPTGAAPTYVPPGWDDWASPSSGNPYAEYNYQLNENGTLRDYGSKPRDYLVDVLAEKSRDFIDAHAGKQPFFLEVAPYVPHQPATPAPRHENAFPEARAPRTRSFDQVDVSAEPQWLRDRPLMETPVVEYIDQLYRRRLQSMLGVEDLLETIVDALASHHELDDTYIVFTSDNGFHLGQHRLPFGKQTAFDEDIHVPLVVRGPGVESGRVDKGFAREIDLAPTFADLAHAETPTFVDGTVLTPLLTGDGDARGLPDDVLVEHYSGGDPSARQARRDEPDDDAAPPTDGAPRAGRSRPLRVPRGEIRVAIPAYEALRTERYLYVEYVTGEQQLFDLTSDRNELHNLAATASPALMERLARRLAALEQCAGATCLT